LLSLLPQQVHLNADETGHKENGHRYWTWCFRAKAFIVFKIHASRGSDVLFDLLGQNFQGSLGADFWGAYRKYAGQCGVLIQFCLAHLIREVKYLCEFPDLPSSVTVRPCWPGSKSFSTPSTAVQNSAQRLLRWPWLPPKPRSGMPHWTRSCSRAAIPTAKFHRLIDNLAHRFSLHGEGCFHFITHPEIQPTNNSAEQALRFVVMDRHMTQGTRSQRGRDFCERLWTVIATCSLQNRSAYVWIHAAIRAHFNGRPVPSLLLDSS